MENNPAAHFIRYGVIYALIQIVITVLSYLAGVDFVASNMFLFAFIMILFSIGYTIYSIIQFRKKSGGYMTLKDGFIVTFFTLALAGLITTVFTIVLYNFIDKEYPQLLAEKSIEKTVSVMESFGASESDIEKYTEEAGDMSERFTILGQIKGYLSALIIYAFYALILGLIFRRGSPPFEQQVNQ